MTRNAYAAAAGLALLLLASSAFAQAPIHIGIPIGLSGANSVVAPSVVQASELAVDEINAKGGILGRPLVPGPFSSAVAAWA